MKKVLLAILVLISFSASAQWTVINGNQRFAKGLGIPTHDTIFTSNPADTSQIVLRPQDSTIYVKYKGKWRKVAGTGGTTPNLQEVTDEGATTTNTLRLYSELDYLGNYNKLHIVDYDLGNNDSSYIDFNVENRGIISGGEKNAQILLKGSNTTAAKIDINTYNDAPAINLVNTNFTQSSYLSTNTLGIGYTPNYPLNTSSRQINIYPTLTQYFNENNVYELRVDTFSSNYTCKLPIVALSTQTTDTLATLRNVRGGASGFVPYTGATGNVNIGTNSFYANGVYPASLISSFIEGNYYSVNKWLRLFDNNFGNKCIELDTTLSPLGASKGRITLKGNGTFTKITSTATTTDKNFILPDSSGTAALKEYTVNSISRTAGKDSIIFYVGSTRYAIKDSVGGANGFVPYTGATQNVDLGSFNLNAQAVKINGTTGNGHIDFKHQSADATATGSSTVLFANSDGDLKYKNDNKYYTTLKTSLNTANRVYTFQDKSYTLADSADVAARVKYTDTATMLSPYLRKIDTATLSTRIDARVKYTDTATMLSPYLRKVDTASLSTRIDTKQDKSLSAYSFMANKTSATANATAQTFKDTSGTYSGTITWTGTTAPSGTTDFTYRWTQVGKLVTLNINLYYATGGSALTQVLMTLPSDCPTPLVPSSMSGASRILYYGSGNLTSNYQLGGGASRAGLRINAANNGYELIIIAASLAAISASITVQYYTN